MDEIDLFGTLRPQPSGDLTSCRERARARLETAMAGPGARARDRRFAGLPLPGRKVVAVSGAALAMGGAVVLPTVLSPGSGGGGSLVTSAWAVQPRQDGTVKVTIKDASDPAGLQRALRTSGVNAIVVSPREISVKNPRGGWVTFPSCSYRSSGPLFASAAVQRNVVTVPLTAKGTLGPSEVVAFIHPAAMPPGSVLFIVDTFSVKANGSRELSITAPAVLKSDRLPRCVAHPMPVPSVSATPHPSPSSPRPVTPTTSPTPVPSGSGSPTAIPTPVPSGSQSPTATPTPVPSGSRSPTTSPTPIPSVSPSRTRSPRPTPSASPAPTPS